MFETNFIQGWAGLVESFATLGIIVTAFCFMLRIVEMRDVLKCIGAILGITIVLILIPAMLVNSWAAMSLWQRVGIAVIGFAIWRLRRPRKRIHWDDA